MKLRFEFTIDPKIAERYTEDQVARSILANMEVNDGMLSSIDLPDDSGEAEEVYATHTEWVKDELWTLTSDLDHFEVHGNFTTVELAKEFAASVADEPIEWEEELVISRDARISFTVYMGGTERFEISPSVTNPTPINKE